MARGALAVVVHIEGADAIDADLNFLDVLYGAGLRSLGPVWSRTNIFGHGVSFGFPSSPDTGDGLTPATAFLTPARAQAAARVRNRACVACVIEAVGRCDCARRAA